MAEVFRIPVEKASDANEFVNDIWFMKMNEVEYEVNDAVLSKLNSHYDRKVLYDVVGNMLHWFPEYKKGEIRDALRYMGRRYYIRLYYRANRPSDYMKRRGKNEKSSYCSNEIKQSLFATEEYKVFYQR